MIPTINKETNTGLGQIQKQPHSNVNISNSNAEADKEKHRMTKYHLTPEPDFEERQIKNQNQTENCEQI